MARICFLTERMLTGWGVDQVVHQVASGLARLGHTVDVLCLKADQTLAVGADYRLRVLDAPWDPADTLEDRIVARGGMLRQRRCDMFIANLYPFFGVADRLGLPFLYYEYGVVDPQGQEPRLQRLLERIRASAPRHQRRARRVVAISEFLKQEQVTPDRHGDTDVVYCGADSYGPPPPPPVVAACRRELGLAADAEVIGYVGRIEANTYKRVEDLVAIAGEVRRRRPLVQLLLVGHASEEAIALFGRQPGVVLRPNARANEMAALYAAMDVVASASVWEGFNLPLAEAQYLARPVVAYRLAAHPEVVGPSGALVRDQHEFAEALLGLLADPDARRRRGTEAAAWAQRFTWAATVANLAASLERAGVPAPR
ncbi:MAG: glycosyltransferase family 4 protein [Candidatus Binatia bacterium]